MPKGVRLIQNQSTEIRITIDSETIFRFMCAHCELRIGDKIALGTRRCNLCCEASGVEAQDCPVPTWVKMALEALEEYGEGE